jgi:integrase
VLTLTEVQRLADAIEPRYRLLVLLAVFGSLRWGELMGLRRSDFDVDAGLVRVERAVSEVGARQIIKKPKTAAGVRVVALPRWLTPELRQHFDSYAEVGADGRVFIGPKGATPLRPNFSACGPRP